MTLLTAATPPGGGEVFLWVDETARNVGPLPGMEAPTNRTSRSLTVHRLFLDSAGRITQAWAPYQLFEEMRRFMLRDDASPGEREGEEAHPGEGEEAQGEGEGDAMEVGTPVAAAPPPGQGEQSPAQTAAGSPAGAAVGGAPGGEAARRASASAAAAAPAAAPDLTALPFVQRLMGSVAPVAAAMASHGLQGEGAAAQSQAAYAVLTGGTPSALPPAGPMGHSSTPPSEIAAAALYAASGGTDPMAAAAADPSAASSMPTAAAAADAALPPPVIPDFEAQAGRSVATWLGLVDSSYSGVRDVFGSMSEGLVLWDALGLWLHLRGARGSYEGERVVGDAVLGELQRLHAEYDIMIRRGSWAVDRAGHVAFCGWEAQAVPLSAGTGTGAGGGRRRCLPRGGWKPAGGRGRRGRAGFAVEGGGWPQRGTWRRRHPGWLRGNYAYIFANLDVYGLSPQGHVTDVVMYRTALPGEAGRVFKGHLLHPPSPPAQTAGPGGA